MNEKNQPQAILRFGSQDVQLKTKIRKYDGFFKLDEYVLHHKLYNGGESQELTREIFERGDAVVLITYDPVNDKVVLIEQFRPGAIRAGGTPWQLEFVAGMFSEGESPVDVAIREAQEEANLIISESEVFFVTKYLSSPGGMSEAIFLYLAKINSENVGGVYGLPEEGEDILVHCFDRQQALQLLSEGKITNASTIIGLQWLALNYQKLQ